MADLPRWHEDEFYPPVDTLGVPQEEFSDQFGAEPLEDSRLRELSQRELLQDAAEYQPTQPDTSYEHT